MTAMERRVATYTENGQIIFPAAVARELALEPGSQFEVTVHEQQIVLAPIRGKGIARLREMLSGRRPLEEELLELRRSERW